MVPCNLLLCLFIYYYSCCCVHTDHSDFVCLMEPGQLISEFAGFGWDRFAAADDDDHLFSWVNLEEFSGMSSAHSHSILPAGPDDHAAAVPPSAPPALPKSIVREREWRRKLNRKLYDLRSVVPNITKMNKASIVEDAIKYIEDLHEEERLLVEESAAADAAANRRWTSPVPGKKRRTESAAIPSSSIEAVEVNVRELGNGMWAISIVCSKKRNAIVRVCELVESLNLRIAAVNISSIFKKIFHSIVVEVDGMQRSACLKEMIEEHLNY